MRKDLELEDIQLLKCLDTEILVITVAPEKPKVQKPKNNMLPCINSANSSGIVNYMLKQVGPSAKALASKADVDKFVAQRDVQVRILKQLIE